MPGVRERRAHDGPRGLVIRFAPRAARVYRRIAGKRITVGCDTVAPSGGGFVTTGGVSMELRAPKRRGTIRTLNAGPADYCAIRVRARGSDPLVVMAPVTDAGRTYVDELATVGLMYSASTVTGAENNDDRVLTIDEVGARGRGLVIALEGPDATPPAGYLTGAGGATR